MPDPIWVVTSGKPGEFAYCKRCGEGLRIEMPCRAEVVAAASKAFVKAHRGCKPGTEIAQPEITPVEWAMGRDTGTSSMTIYSAITGIPTHFRRYDIPYDPDDFGRCSRLLALFPSWREQLHKVVAICPAWDPFVEHWDELQALYDEEAPSKSCPKLYDRMKRLEGRKF